MSHYNAESHDSAGAAPSRNRGLVAGYRIPRLHRPGGDIRQTLAFGAQRRHYAVGSEFFGSDEEVS